MFDSVFIERFEEKFVKSDGCWLWTASCAGKGYGQMKLPKQRKQEYAHRLAYQIYKGEIPKCLQVMHSCDNPKCCNPDHLSIGTCKDNLQDMKQKGRSTHGEKNARAKITEDQVIQIRKCIESGMTQSKIALAFGISQIQVSRINTGKRWERVK